MAYAALIDGLTAELAARIETLILPRSLDTTAGQFSFTLTKGS